MVALLLHPSGGTKGGGVASTTVAIVFLFLVFDNLGPRCPPGKYCVSLPSCRWPLSGPDKTGKSGGIVLQGCLRKSVMKN